MRTARFLIALIARLREKKQAGLFGVSSAPLLAAPQDAADALTARGGSIPNRRRRVKSTPALTA